MYFPETYHFLSYVYTSKNFLMLYLNGLVRLFTLLKGNMINENILYIFIPQISYQYLWKGDLFQKNLYISKSGILSLSLQ